MQLYAELISGSLWAQKRFYEMCYIYVWTLLTSKDKGKAIFSVYRR